MSCGISEYGEPPLLDSLVGAGPQDLTNEGPQGIKRKKLSKGRAQVITSDAKPSKAKLGRPPATPKAEPADASDDGGEDTPSPAIIMCASDMHI